MRLRAAARAVEIVVSDTGIGIDDDDLDRSSRRSSGRAAPGAGRPGCGARPRHRPSIVSAHGGRIEVGSTPDVGTSVRILLPHDPGGAGAATS